MLVDFNQPTSGRTITLGATSGTGSGTIDLKLAAPNNANVSGDSLKVLLNTAKLYVNVHSANNGGGEILGNIIKQ